jgi:hypothetical protein
MGGSCCPENHGLVEKPGFDYGSVSLLDEFDSREASLRSLRGERCPGIGFANTSSSLLTPDQSLIQSFAAISIDPIVTVTTANVI